MVTLSTAAEECIDSLFASAVIESDAVVRVRKEGEDWSLHLDRELPKDETVERRGRTLLVADEETSEALHGVVLDFRDGDEGPKFVLVSLEGDRNG